MNLKAKLSVFTALICLAIGLFLYSCVKGSGKKQGRPFSTSETIVDPSIPQTLAIETGSLAGTQVEVSANSLPVGATVTLAKSSQPAEFTSLTQGDNSAGSLAIQISFADANGQSIDPSVPITVTMPVESGSLELTALEQNLSALYAVLLADDASKFFWSSSMFISIDKVTRLIQFQVRKGGVFQLVYLAAAPVGFTSAVESGIAPAPTIEGQTYAGSCILAESYACEGFKSASSETKTKFCDKNGGVWSENAACAASYLGICHVYQSGVLEFDHYYYPEGAFSISAAKDDCLSAFAADGVSAVWEPGEEPVPSSPETPSDTVNTTIYGKWKLSSQTCNGLKVEQAGLAVSSVIVEGTITQTTVLNLAPLACTTVQVFDISLPGTGQLSSQDRDASCTPQGTGLCPTNCPKAKSAPNILSYTVDATNLVISSESSSDCKGKYVLSYTRL
ncbi:MAG: hypothetical protein NTX25_12705 [Proteobacteria bacterium]|nr:hypothetical protein [Pseudomonadota bacterium]